MIGTANSRIHPAYVNEPGESCPGLVACHRSNSQHLFLLCGLPFSGKSTLGRALQARHGIVHVEVDRHHLDGRIDFEDRRVERAEWIAAYRAAYTQVEEALGAGRPVVFDAVSYRRTQRDRTRRIAKKHGVPITIIYVDVAPELAKARLNRNRANPTRVNVPQVDFDEVARGMQPPQHDEALVTYRPGEPVEFWIERVIAPLLKESAS
jgi:predicted kinase